jgi:hypothetical protein
MANAMPVSVELRGDFAKLKGQVEEAQRTIVDAAAQDPTEVDAKADEARKSADARAAELQAETERADRSGNHWQQIRADWDRHIQHTRERMDAKKAAVDASVAENDAVSAEDDAYDAIDFAASAIEEAEYAVLGAVSARKKADALQARPR